MRPTRFLRVYNEFRSPWERKNAWRSQAPFKQDASLYTYDKYLRYSVGIYAVYWTWREVVKHGPLRPYVYGEDQPDHEHGDGHGTQAVPSPA